ncbi:MAG: AlpA family phage regulatory protein [Xanthobacteraceae bacterium]
MSKTKSAAQPAFARKAAALRAASGRPETHLLTKPEILAIAGVTYPTIWAWMRAGMFPRSRIAGGRSVWRSDEIAKWLAGLPVRPLKGDKRQHDTAAA